MPPHAMRGRSAVATFAAVSIRSERPLGAFIKVNA